MTPSFGLALCQALQACTCALWVLVLCFPGHLFNAGGVDPNCQPVSTTSCFSSLFVLTWLVPSRFSSSILYIFLVLFLKVPISWCSLFCYNDFDSCRSGSSEWFFFNLLPPSWPPAVSSSAGLTCLCDMVLSVNLRTPAGSELFHVGDAGLSGREGVCPYSFLAAIIPLHLFACTMLLACFVSCPAFFFLKE